MATNGKKSRKKIIIISGIGLVLVVLGVFVFLGSKKEPILAVNVEKVTSRTLTQVVTATGKIQPEIHAAISPEVSGEIVLLPVKEGYRVKKGDVLLKIKPDIYVAQRDQFKAGLQQVKSVLVKAEADYKRAQGLMAKNLIAESDFDQAKSSYEGAKAQYQQAEASLNQAEESLRKTTITSPMDGTISQLNNQLGERVLGTQQFQGTNVMTVADLSHMEADVDVSENDVTLVHVGDTARISIDAFPDRKLNAVVYEIANTGSSKNLGTQEEVTNFTVKMRVVDPGVTLRPGMSMTADIETMTKQNVLSVPIQSVTTRAPKMEMKEGQSDGQSGMVMASGQSQKTKEQNKPKEIVFVVENGVAKAVPVKRGIASDQYVEIVDGVTEGAQVVSGSYKAINRELEDGAKVRVEEVRKPGPGQPGQAS
ncbi:MAG TPA: efflux RND transporter periplasmic adaptor subunit [Bacteroidota bacterium]|nr:efflux RND transporter periplasmic adaptor subunit [Bacteroidota bacterium]